MNRDKRDEEDENSKTIHWSFDVGNDYPSIDVAEVIAELEGKESSELPSMYERIDHLIEELFSTPPASEAEAVLQFSYEGYRITLNQDGHATFKEITGEE